MSVTTPNDFFAEQKYGGVTGFSTLAEQPKAGREIRRLTRRRAALRKGAATVALLTAGTVGAVKLLPPAVDYAEQQLRGNPVEVPADTESYKVQAGDTASTIAGHYDVDENTQPLINRIHEAGGDDGLKVGEVVQIPAVDQTEELNQ